MKRTYLLFALLFVLLVAPADAAVQVRVAHSIMPAISGAVNVIRIQLDAPLRPDGERYAATLQSGSSAGLLSFGVNSAQRLELALTPQEWTEVHYRWSGPIPTEAAHEEQLALEIPALGIRETIRLSIGIDLEVHSIAPDPRAPKDAPFLPVRVLVRDRFHPTANLEKILETWGIQPELRLVLSDLDTGKPREDNRADPVFRRFFGSSTSSAVTAVWPTEKPEPGKIKQTEEGWRWTGATGQEPGFTPQPGTFQIRAFLWSKAGNVGIREGQTEPFVIPGQQLRPSAPGLIGSTLRILAELNPVAFPELNAQVNSLLSGGDADAVVRLLGGQMRELFKNSSLHTLGRYAQSLAASGMDAREVARFLHVFTQGYVGHGLVIIVPGGVASLSVADASKVAFKDAPDGLRGSGNTRERVFRGGNLTVIPFVQGESLILEIKGSGKGNVQLWKLLPDGINAKNYPAGQWEKEVTVYGDRVAPPAPK